MKQHTIDRRSKVSKTTTVRHGVSDLGIRSGDDPADVWKKTRNACVSAVEKTLLSYMRTKSDMKSEPPQLKMEAHEQVEIEPSLNDRLNSPTNEILKAHVNLEPHTKIDSPIKTGNTETDSHALAKSYELEMYKRFSHSLTEYKLTFRKHLTAMKNFNKNDFVADLLNGDVSVHAFVNLKEKDLISAQQKKKNSKLLSDQLKNTMGTSFPTNINQIKNQNTVTAEKWGISESAARIDPDFDHDGTN